MTTRMGVRVLLLLAAVCSLAWGQVTIAGPMANMKPGQTAVLSLNLAGAAGTAAAQGTVALPAGWPATCTIGAAVANSKQVACAVTPEGQLTWIVYGLNQTVLSDGALLKVSVVIPPGARAGTNMISISGTLGASPEGDAMPVGAGGPFTLSITSACDINGDGTVNVGDVQALAGQILAAPGALTVVDLQRVIVSALGGACKAGT